MNYDTFKYLYPPRPEIAIAPESLAWYEQRGWTAQFKKNGTNTIIAISPEKNFIAMNRHKENHKAWTLTEYIKEELVRLFIEKFWFVLVSEIMHSKTKTIKDTIYIHDILVFKSKFLYDSEFEFRQQILDERLITNVETKTHYVSDSQNKIWYAKRYTKNFEKLFWGIENPSIDEGLVLKNPKGKLKMCDKPDANKNWQIKVRHSCKKYSF